VFINFLGGRRKFFAAYGTDHVRGEVGALALKLKNADVLLGLRWIFVLRHIVGRLSVQAASFLKDSDLEPCSCSAAVLSFRKCVSRIRLSISDSCAPSVFRRRKRRFP